MLLLSQKLVRAAPDDPEAWRLYRLFVASPAGRSVALDEGEEWDVDSALRRSAAAELRCDPSSESALAAVLALRQRRACSARLALASAVAHVEVCSACPHGWHHLATALGAPPRPTAGRRAASVWTPARAAEWRTRFFALGAGMPRDGEVGPAGADASTLRDIAVVAAHLRASGRGGGAFGRAVASRLAAAGHAELATEVRTAHWRPPTPPPDEPPSAGDARFSLFDDAIGDVQADGHVEPRSPPPRAWPTESPVRSRARSRSPPRVAAPPRARPPGSSPVRSRSRSLSPSWLGASLNQGPCASCAHGRKGRTFCRVKRQHTAPAHVAEACDKCARNARAAAATAAEGGGARLLRPCVLCFHNLHATARHCRLLLGHVAPEHERKGCAACAMVLDTRRTKRRGGAAAADDADAEGPAAKRARAAYE